METKIFTKNKSCAEVNWDRAFVVALKYICIKDVKDFACLLVKGIPLYVTPCPAEFLKKPSDQDLQCLSFSL